jgi:3-dehydroquinate dehydratase/shikimate dehydrogenase
MADLIASIFAVEPAATAALARQAARAGADWIELRLDRWPRQADLRPLIAEMTLPVLVSCRTPRDHGGFTGTLAERRALLERALEAGAQGIDLEEWERWDPPAGGPRLHIRSHHNFTGVDDHLPAIRDRLLGRGATLAKIVVMAHDLTDAEPVMELLAGSDQDAEPTTAFALGRTAWPTRVLAALLGAPMVYGSVADGEETAPGQVPVRLLAELYRVQALTSRTAVYGLLGNPALHSLGPWLHNRALRRLGVDGVYLPFETSRPEALVAMLSRRRLRGLSVTAPFKEQMLGLCHRLDDAARAAGAVNTITFEAHGVVVGHNTDVAGVAGALQRAGLPGGAGQRAAVIGCGGAGRAAGEALAGMGYAVTFLGRSFDGIREHARARGYPLAGLRAAVLDELHPRVVVHATPVGGDGGPADQRRVVPEWMPDSGSFVLDMIYRPRRTALLEDAARAGAVAVPGIEMFLTQAARQVELFTGRRLEEAELRLFLAGS